MIRFLLLILPLYTSLNYAQTFVRIINEIPFTQSSTQLRNVFSGGVSGVEHQFVDIDGDNDLDLFYLNSDGSFEFMENIGTPSSSDFFISDNQIDGLKLSHWFYFIDIDSDDDFDLFIGGEGNTISFLKNIGNKFNPSFIIEMDTVKDNDGNVLFSDNVSNPVFGDIDADGDYDFLLGTQNGSVTLYENIGNAMQFSFKFTTSTWQNISIIGGGKQLHGASSLEIKDIENDGDLDILWGDFFSRSIYLLQNFGTPSEPNIKLTFNVFPQNEDSIFTRGYNMPRLADIDSDGDDDLFVSVLFDPTVPQTLMFFENQGTAAIPDFRKITEDYFSTLDAGTKSIPAFIDIDNDGDLDLFIGNEKFLSASINFYENIGVNGNEYILADTAFFGITDVLSISPAFGDLDGDGDYDLLIGTYQGKCILYRNIGTAVSPNFVHEGFLKDDTNSDIQFSSFLRPQLVDIDGDNDLDLVLGAFNGGLQLYINNGTSNNFNFSNQPGYFNGIDVGDQSFPFLIDYDNDDDLDLFIGNRTGDFYYYRNEGNTQLPQFNLVTEKFIDFNFGRETAPVFVDLDADTDADVFIGSVKGGLYYFKNQTVTSITETANNKSIDNIKIETYPNPFNSSVKISVGIQNRDVYTITVFDILGKKILQIYSGELTAGNYHYNWNGKNLAGLNVPSGVYLIALTNNSIVKANRVLLIK